MKANEAPEKLYVDVNDNLSDSFLYGFTEKRKEDDIEYTHTDAFIEKVCVFLKDRIEHDSIDYPMATKHLVEDFKNYIKGE